MESKRILLVEDDKDISALVDLHLRDQNYEVFCERHGTKGLDAFNAGVFDLVILDVMLPGLSGFDICREIRSRGSYVPILMLTSKSEELDKVLGLELGADDYLTKPFSIRELVARVKALIRRSSAPSSTTSGQERDIRFGDLHIDLEKRKVVLAGQQIELTSKEYDLLVLFAETPGRAFSRSELLEMVWGYQYAGYSHTVNSHINRLRGKIEPDPSQPSFIQTVWGVGYRFAEDVAHSKADRHGRE